MKADAHFVMSAFAQSVLPRRGPYTEVSGKTAV